MVIESVASKRSSCTISTGRGLPASCLPPAAVHSSPRLTRRCRRRHRTRRWHRRRPGPRPHAGGRPPALTGGEPPRRTPVRGRRAPRSARVVVPGDAAWHGGLRPAGERWGSSDRPRLQVTCNSPAVTCGPTDRRPPGTPAANAPQRSEGRNRHLVAGVSGERSEIHGIAGEHSCSAALVCDGDDDRIDGGGGTTRGDLGPQPSRSSGQDLVNRSDVARAEQAILLKIAAVVTGERLCQNDGGHDRRPFPASPELGEAGAISCETGQAVRVEDDGHAERRVPEGPRAFAAQVSASARSVSVMGPSSPSSSAR